LVQLASPVISLHLKILLDWLATNRIPAVCELRRHVEGGCLMTYSADLGAMFRGLAWFTAQILRGAKPSDLPIEQPREFEFVVNIENGKSAWTHHSVGRAGTDHRCDQVIKPRA